MIADMRLTGGTKTRRVIVLRPIGDGFYYLVDDGTGLTHRLVRYDRLSVAGVPLKGPAPKAAA